MNRQELGKQKRNIPQAPGVYFFKGARGKILYIGKATNLRARVQSYFNTNLGAARGPAIERMVDEARRVAFEETDSVLEALLLEAELIKTYEPPYNTKEKSGKSFNCIVVTAEEYPRILLMRKRELEEGRARGKVLHKGKEIAIKHIFGPFPHGGELKEALKIIRKILPFRDTCVPGSGTPCFNAQIGLCPGVCAGTMSKEEYGKRIKNITLLLSGKKKTLIRALERDMAAAAKEEAFERAGEIKKKIFALTHIRDVSLIKADYVGSDFGYRVEGYDIAHTSGTHTVGVMVVVEDGERAPEDYRVFNIKSVVGPDDTKSIAEVLMRRFGHPEWPYPKLIVIDGGRAQKNRAEKILADLGIKIPVVSVVKDEHHRPREILGLISARATAREREILLANSEAHRFALAKHRKKRAI